MQKPTTLAPGYERLEKVMAHKGLSSRREAKALITKGAVSVNGRMVTEPGFGVMPETDAIEIDGIDALAPKESFLVYKPRGIETSKTSPSSKDLHDQFPALKHLHPIGRLDKESEGLIIMSDDGVLARALTRIGSTVGKTYLATVREQVPDASLTRMANGIRIDGIMTLPAKVTRASRTSFTITLHEGRKHQIRRMGDACKLTLESLERVAIGHLTAGSMKPGEMKRIPTKDVEILRGTE